MTTKKYLDKKKTKLIKCRDGNKFFFVWIYLQGKKKGKRFFRAYCDQDSVNFLLFPLKLDENPLFSKVKNLFPPPFPSHPFFYIPNSCLYSKNSFVVYLSGIFIYSQNTSLLKKHMPIECKVPKMENRSFTWLTIEFLRRKKIHVIFDELNNILKKKNCRNE